MKDEHERHGKIFKEVFRLRSKVYARKIDEIIKKSKGVKKVLLIRKFNLMITKNVNLMKLSGIKQ